MFSKICTFIKCTMALGKEKVVIRWPRAYIVAGHYCFRPDRFRVDESTSLDIP